MRTENTIFAVMDVTFKDIKSKWFIVEDDQLINVTSEVFEAVQEYNETASLVIPYRYKNNHIVYSFGCGLTHYLQSDNVSEVLTGFNVDHISVYTKEDIENFYERDSFVNALKEVSGF
jgi:hypothetical protein